MAGAYGAPDDAYGYGVAGLEFPEESMDPRVTAYGKEEVCRSDCWTCDTCDVPSYAILWAIL